MSWSDPTIIGLAGYMAIFDDCGLVQDSYIEMASKRLPADQVCGTVICLILIKRKSLWLTTGLLYIGIGNLASHGSPVQLCKTLKADTR